MITEDHFNTLLEHSLRREAHLIEDEFEKLALVEQVLRDLEVNRGNVFQDISDSDFECLRDDVFEHLLDEYPTETF